MQLQTGNHQINKGWAELPQGSLDSPQTLVLAFGAKSFETAPAPFEALAAAFPNSAVTEIGHAMERSLSSEVPFTVFFY